MKKLLVIILVVFLASGCRSTKKATKSNINTQTESVIKTESKVADKIKEDKNLNIETVTTITETEYNEPDSVKSTNSEAKGSVKSTKTTVIKTVQTDKGKIETEHKENAKTEVEKEEDTKTKVDETEKVKVPIRWGWIFGILALLTGLIVYFRNSPVVKSVLLFIRKFLKI